MCSLFPKAIFLTFIKILELLCVPILKINMVLVIDNHLMKFLENSDILYDLQYEFR